SPGGYAHPLLRRRVGRKGQQPIVRPPLCPCRSVLHLVHPSRGSRTLRRLSTFYSKTSTLFAGAFTRQVFFHATSITVLTTSTCILLLPNAKTERARPASIASGSKVCLKPHVSEPPAATGTKIS